MTDYINIFQPYILNDNNMTSYLKYKLSRNDNNNEKNKIITIEKKNIPINFVPREQDTLFWCYYIIKNGDIKYEMLNNRNSLMTKQFKIEYVSKIRENKQIVKTYKFDTITNLESNLVNDNNINIKTIMTLCAIENINLIFISKKTYFEFLNNDSGNIYIIREIDLQSKYSKKYGYELANDNILNEIRNTLYKVETLDKPIKSLSSYKVQDLIDICNKLAIEIKNNTTGKNKTKNELYESIIQYF
jgi:hypothetical protein